MKRKIFVTKASGERQLFTMEKLSNSLKRAGASEGVVKAILGELEPKLYDGITTKKIYSQAHRMLHRLASPQAARYHLKRGLMQLGPSGFPFEKFVARLFAEEDYVISPTRFIKGKCVQHEVDVYARRGEEVLVAECKYHNRGGIATDVKVPLYVHARFEDIKAGNMFIAEANHVAGYVITNGRFTADAVTYGNCSGLHLISWDYPLQHSLRDRIDKFGLYPLTCLGSLTGQEKEGLLAAGFVLVRDLLNDVKKVERVLGISKAGKVVEDADRLWNNRDTGPGLATNVSAGRTLAHP